MKGAGFLLVFRVKKAIFGERFKEVTPVTRYLVCRFVLSAAMVPVAVSHDPGENKPLMTERATWLHRVRGGSPAHSARDSRQAHQQISTKARAEKIALSRWGQTKRGSQAYAS
jgi:hypothetical protein